MKSLGGKYNKLATSEEEEGILKKKKKQIKPKQVVLDEQGQEWEVVDKKRAFVEVEEEEEQD